jgi:hypothetical protein
VNEKGVITFRKSRQGEETGEPHKERKFVRREALRSGMKGLKHGCGSYPQGYDASESESLGNLNKISAGSRTSGSVPLSAREPNLPGFD